MTTDASRDSVAVTPRPIGSLWLIPLTLGVVRVITGLLALFWPGETVLVVAVLFGVQLLVVGFLRLLQAFLRPGAGTGIRVVDGILGVLFVAVGVLCLRDVMQTVAVLALLLGLVWLVGGMLELVGALAEGPPARWTGATVLSLLTGLVSVVGGLVILAYPGLSLGALAILLGIFLVVYGVAAIVQAFRLRTP
jgi:uncharacterized membrane protein HdeD (DUF308 family)